MSNKIVYFKNLDAIRFFAAMMVFISHAMSKSFNHFKIEDSIIEKTLFVISNGAMGVSIFFVLSGFLITYLIVTEIELNGELDLKKF